jgi:hypothetical protein
MSPDEIIKTGVVLLILFSCSFVMGLRWRWHLLSLFIVCFVSATILFVATRNWSDLNLSAILKTPRSWPSWIIGLPLELIPTLVPVFVGCSLGFAVRLNRKSKRS